jgi:hypothetical protein
VHHGDLALVRLDDEALAASTLLGLFHTREGWRIAAELRLAAAQGTHRRRFDPITAEREVLEVLAKYYRAVDRGDAAMLEPVFAAGWHMKNLDQGQVVAEDKQRFMRRIDGDPLPDYSRDRQITAVQVLFDRVAAVRIDKPSTRGVTLFLFARLSTGWRIVDKLWTAPG